MTIPIFFIVYINFGKELKWNVFWRLDSEGQKFVMWGFGLLAEETIKSYEFWAQGATSQILEEISFQE